MVRHLTRTSRLFTSALAFAMAFASSATCFAAVAQMSERTQHACCEGVQDCAEDPTPVLMGCCSVQSADLVRTASLAQAVSPVARTVLAPFAAEPSSIVPTSVAAAFDSGAPRPFSAPTYVLDSVFRL